MSVQMVFPQQVVEGSPCPGCGLIIGEGCWEPKACIARVIADHSKAPGFVSSTLIAQRIRFLRKEANEWVDNSGLKEEYRSVAYAAYQCALDAVAKDLGLGGDDSA